MTKLKKKSFKNNNNSSKQSLVGVISEIGGTEKVSKIKLKFLKNKIEDSIL